ncbi:MAG: arginase [Acidobacteriota bacterium]
MSPTSQRTVSIIGIPMDLGQNRRGVDMGPSALRYAGLQQKLERLGYQVEDRGNLELVDRAALPPEGGLAYLPEVVKACDVVYAAGRDAIARGTVPVFLGGDHSIAAGTVGGVTDSGRAGLVWVDAHGDFNTPETSPSGNVHGMPLAALMGLGDARLVDQGRPGPKIPPKDVVLIGIRDLDEKERVALRESKATVYTMREIDERGIAEVAAEAISRLSHTDRVHVSLDMDSVDPSFAPGVGTPVAGGLTFREAHLLMELLAEGAEIGSIDIVEVNPILDTHNQTAALALQLLTSLLGQTIF